ncbi:VanZ family protein (plasmid) [Paraclostridium bifermentans]|uniref:VanZ family protein n=1 Tax=Paraclostridium bifermentans TaxID=1490 RepID=A0ABY8R8J3_PARBF|nr:VanZ family protein [Paraclostridium bifermentans]
MRKLKLKKTINYKQMLYIIFLIYLLILIKIILFKTNSFIDLLKGNTSAGYRSSNLIPFKTIVTFFNMKDFSFLRAFSNTVGNIAIFLPLGYLLPILIKKINSMSKVFLISISVSMVFESLQYIFCLGSLDIDDIILNTLGGVIGYIIYFYIKKFSNSNKFMYKISLILSIIAFIIGFPIAKTEFGNLLGITTEETLYINKEVIPDEDPDIRGTYISKEDDYLKIYDSIIAKSSQEKEF